MRYILQNVDETSLVIIDELGRGTSIDEGMGFCFAMSERLLATKAMTFLATHFLPITNLQAIYPNVEKYAYYIYIYMYMCTVYVEPLLSSYAHVHVYGVRRTLTVKLCTHTHTAATILRWR